MYILMRMNTKVQKWGNSLAVRLPSDIAKKLSITDGTSVRLSEKNGVVELSRITKPESYSLKELLARITPENMHAEVDWGAPVGKEIW